MATKSRGSRRHGRTAPAVVVSVVAALAASASVMATGHGVAAPPHQRKTQSSLDPTHRAALVALYNATGGPRGAWNRYCQWNVSAAASPCGNGANQSTAWYGVSCNEQGSLVISIVLDACGLRGTIPGDVGMLSALKYLRLPNNSLAGSLPQQLAGLSALKGLDLSHNALTGSLEHLPDTAASMQFVDVSFNKLSGVLPANHLRAWAPSLLTLDVSANHLTGSLPAALGRMEALSSLHVGSNLFEGSLPPEMAALAGLREFRVNDNRLSGSLDVVWEAGAHAVLDARDNFFVGRIDTDAAVRSLSFTPEVHLGNNKLTGVVPACRDFGRSTLSTLELELNEFDAIADGIGNCTMLHTLRVQDNRIGGTLPRSMAQLENLVEFDASDNPLLNVSLADARTLFNTTSLVRLRLGNVALTEATIPYVVTQWPLDELYLPSNGIMALPSPAACASWKVTALNVSRNSIEVLPQALFRAPQLGSLDVSHNHIATRLHGTIVEAPLALLDMSANPKLCGTLPPALLNTPTMHSLHADGCALSGTLPSNIHAPALLNVFLENNYITGTIPPALALSPRITNLALSHNRLDGTLPQQWSESLAFLAVTNNDLTGSIPADLLTLPHLEALLLGRNQLEGNVANLSLPALRGLDLSDNPIGGPAPVLGPLVTTVSLSRTMLQGSLRFSGAARANTTLVNISASLSRLGGVLPRVNAPHAQTVDVLAGNLWACPPPTEPPWALDTEIRTFACSGERASSWSLVLTGMGLVMFAIAARARQPEPWRDDVPHTRRSALAASLHESLLRPAPPEAIARDESAHLQHDESADVAGDSSPSAPSRDATPSEVALHNGAARASVVWGAAFAAQAAVLATLFVVGPTTLNERPVTLAATAAYVGDHTGTFGLVLALIWSLPALTLIVWWHTHRQQRSVLHVTDDVLLRADVAPDAAPSVDDGESGPGTSSPVATHAQSASEATRGISDPGDTPQPTERRTGRCAAALMVMATAVLCALPNAVYVVLERAVSAGGKEALKAGMAVIKAMLNTVVLSAAAEYAARGRGRRQKADTHILLTAVLQHVNTAIVPVLATVLLHPNCLAMFHAVPDTVLVVPVHQCDDWVARCTLDGHPGGGLPRECGARCTQKGGQCGVICNAGGVAVHNRDVVVDHPWRYSTACPSSLIQLYGQVFALYLILQGVVWNAVMLLRTTDTAIGVTWAARLRLHSVSMPCCNGRRRNRCARRVIASVLEPQVTARAAWSRLFNLLEVTAVFGPFDAVVAAAGVVALVCHAVTVFRLPELADPRGVHGPPLPSIVMTLTVYSALVSWFLVGGDLWPRGVWVPPLALGVGTWGMLMLGLVLSECHVARGRAGERAKRHPMLPPAAGSSSFQLESAGVTDTSVARLLRD